MSTRGEVLLQLMNKLIFLGLIPVLMLTAQNVYAGGVRGDTPDGATPDEVDCWVDGYDDGFAGKYDKDRGSECEEIGDDNYDYVWNYGCEEAGLTVRECEEIRD